MRYFVCIGKGRLYNASEVEAECEQDAVERFLEDVDDDLRGLLGEKVRVFTKSDNVTKHNDYRIMLDLQRVIQVFAVERSDVFDKLPKGSLQKEHSSVFKTVEYARALARKHSEAHHVDFTVYGVEVREDAVSWYGKFGLLREPSTITGKVEDDDVSSTASPSPMDKP